MQTVNIKTRCQTCKEDMDKVLLEKIAKLEEENKSLKKKNEFLLKVNDLLEEENLDYRYDILDTAYDQATEMAKDWEEQYKYEIAVLEKALELACEDINSLYRKKELKAQTKLVLTMQPFGFMNLIEHFKKQAKESINANK